MRKRLRSKLTHANEITERQPKTLVKAFTFKAAKKAVTEIENLCWLPIGDWLKL